MIALPEKILPHSILGFVTNHPTGCQEEYDQTNRHSNNKHRNTNDVMPNFYFSFFLLHPYASLLPCGVLRIFDTSPCTEQTFYGFVL